MTDDFARGDRPLALGDEDDRVDGDAFDAPPDPVGALGLRTPSFDPVPWLAHAADARLFADEGGAPSRVRTSEEPEPAPLPRLPYDDSRAFWALVARGADEACWPWLGRFDDTGAPVYAAWGRKHRAARYAWGLVRGAMPPGRCVTQSCGGLSCVNPRHLVLGAYRATGHGTHPGLDELRSRAGRARLRALYATGRYTLTDLAREFGVDEPRVWQIATRPDILAALETDGADERSDWFAEVEARGGDVASGAWLRSRAAGAVRRLRRDLRGRR